MHNKAGLRDELVARRSISQMQDREGAAGGRRGMLGGVLASDRELLGGLDAHFHSAARAAE